MNWVKYITFITDSIAHRAKRRYLSYSEADFDFFFARMHAQHLNRWG